MLPRRYRLRSRSDVQRVKRRGRRWRHPLAILLVSPAEKKMIEIPEAIDPNRQSISRFAFTASRRVGPAVSRSRAKRLMREAVRSNLAEIEPGWDCLLIARHRTPQASFSEVETAVTTLFSRAHLLNHPSHRDGSQGA